eukprot:CAMPEP_0113996404 /NCGR_PEP_ID=MMETSP0328-20130328/11733_1 /TAXON_ID=39455 /ORGANISM="Alexandrium minutum" /LENGTH=39 /assembly_acc=CAM_ASM_000350
MASALAQVQPDLQPGQGAEQDSHRGPATIQRVVSPLPVP